MATWRSMKKTLVACCLVLSCAAAGLVSREITLPTCPPVPEIPMNLKPASGASIGLKPAPGEHLVAVIVADGPMEFECSHKRFVDEEGEEYRESSGSIRGLRIFNYGAVLSQQLQQQQTNGNGQGAGGPSNRLPPVTKDVLQLPRNQLGPEIGYLQHFVDSGLIWSGDSNEWIGIQHEFGLWDEPSVGENIRSFFRGGNGLREDQTSPHHLWTGADIHRVQHRHETLFGRPGWIPARYKWWTRNNNIRAYRLFSWYAHNPTGQPCDGQLDQDGKIKKIDVPFRAVYLMYGPDALVSDGGEKRIPPICKP